MMNPTPTPSTDHRCVGQLKHCLRSLSNITNATTLTNGMVIPLLVLLSVPAQAADSIMLRQDGAACRAPVVELPPVLAEGSSDDEEIAIEGDELETGSDNSIIMQGKAQITQGKRGVFADKIIYERDKFIATAKGNVTYYTIGGDRIKSDSMRLEVDSFIGELGASEMWIAERTAPAKRRTKNYTEDFSFFAPLTNRIDPGLSDDTQVVKGKKVSTRINAEHIAVEGQGFQRLTNANMTRCPEGNRDVEIIGKEVELDHDTGVALAKGVTLKFKGVPIFYAPRMSFPIGDQRKSGFLFPSIGQDAASGTILALPYYYNIAPNIDATIRPTWYSERGLQVYGEMRFLGEHSDGNLKGEYMPSDALLNDDARYAFGLDYKLRLPGGWGARVDLQDVSDTKYLSDFSNDVEITSSTYIPQTGEITYRNSLLNLTAGVKKYQLVDETISNFKPYDRLPDITLDLHPSKFGLFEMGMDAEYISFDHTSATRVTGTRLRATPWVGVPIEPIWGFFKPKWSLRHLSYSLDDDAGSDASSPSVSVPAFSIDSGMYFERDMNWGSKAYLQTLEPRVMYVNVTKEDQSTFPNFDTGSGSVSSFNYLFREERFFGGDRIGDDHHIALGLTTRIIDDEDGSEKLKASIGQLYYIDDREVGLVADSEAETETKSDVFADLNAQLTDGLSANSFLRFDQKESEISSWNMGARFDDGLRRQASVDYFFTSQKEGEDSKDIRLGLDWPLSPRLQLGLDQRYSIDQSEVRSSSVRITYDACCWALGLAANRTLLGDGEYRDSILATLELDGIGRVQSGQ